MVCPWLLGALMVTLIEVLVVGSVLKRDLLDTLLRITMVEEVVVLYKRRMTEN